MVAALVGSTWSENFVYSGTPNSDLWAELPPTLDFRGAVETNDGWFSLAGATGWVIRRQTVGNEDAKFPYGGTLSSDYLRSPSLGWSQLAGVIIRPRTTSANSVLAFQMNHTGHAKDKLYVLVQSAAGNWSQREILTGKAGFGWTLKRIGLEKGSSAVCILMRTAPWSSVQATYRGQTELQTEAKLAHRLRLANLSITYSTLAGPRSSTGLRVNLASGSTLVADAETTRIASVDMRSDSRLLLASQVTPHLDLLADGVLTVADIEAGVEFDPDDLLDDSFLTITVEINALSVSATGGFQVGSRMSIAIETTVLPELAGYVRPLMTTTVTMTIPAIIRGIPHTPRARSLTNSVTTIGTEGAVIGRISPESVDHVYPNVAAAGQPLWRWLSIDAEYDDDGELVEWQEHAEHGTTAGPTWSTPGAFRPTVANHIMQTDSQHRPINYPAVFFDGSRLDHLNIDLGSGYYTDAGAGKGRSFTWFIVGSFTRFRGMLRDSSPIIDFTSTATIDYTIDEETAPMVADRENLPPWFDAPTEPTMYTGWHAYSDADPETSTIGWRGVAGAPTSSARIAYSDDTPVVMAICVSGSQSYVMMTPVLGGGPAQLTTYVTGPRAVFGVNMPSTVTLGKGRSVPPFSGLFGTGSMALLEVALYNKYLLPEQAKGISQYLAGVYAPASLVESREGSSTTRALSKYPVRDPEMVFASTVLEDPYYLLQQGMATELEGITANGVYRKFLPTAFLTPTDYASFVANFQEDV